MARLTTLELGGPARCLVRVHSEDELRWALDWAGEQGLPVFVLGGGSNVVIADTGFAGLVVQVAISSRDERRAGEHQLVRVGAGQPWDPFVRDCVARGWAGVECLVGIPGLVGAVPIQNVGAYGQEVSDVIDRVRAYDQTTDTIVELSPAQCGFGYRDSRFKKEGDRWIVIAVEFRLCIAGAPTVRYAELERELGESTPSIATVAATVERLRRSKSMVIDPNDPNRRSVGSFFTNPIVDATTLARVVDAAEDRAHDGAAVPRYAVGDGRFKIPAAWLIERAGFAKGLRRGPVGISSRHTLALVHHGGGTTAQLVAFAKEVAAEVERKFGISLAPEPRFVGMSW